MCATRVNTLVCVPAFARERACLDSSLRPCAPSTRPSPFAQSSKPPTAPALACSACSFFRVVRKTRGEAARFRAIIFPKKTVRARAAATLALRVSRSGCPSPCSYLRAGSPPQGGGGGGIPQARFQNSKYKQCEFPARYARGKRTAQPPRRRRRATARRRRRSAQSRLRRERATRAAFGDVSP